MDAKRLLEYAIAAGDDLESIQRYIEAESRIFYNEAESRIFYNVQ